MFSGSIILNRHSLGRPLIAQKLWYTYRPAGALPSLIAGQLLASLLRDGSNTRSTCRFNALMTPMRANIVGPPSVATRITYSASHPSASAAARNVRQASISPASDALAWLRA